MSYRLIVTYLPVYSGGEPVVERIECHSKPELEKKYKEFILRKRQDVESVRVDHSND